MFTNQINIDEFLKNLRDLNEIAKKISGEIEKKNQILKGGLADNNKYRKLLDKQRELLRKH